MKKLFFKAGRKKSSSCGAYREIIKSGDTSFDFMNNSDDAIILQNCKTVIIDCDKKTGVFRIQIN